MLLLALSLLLLIVAYFVQRWRKGEARQLVTFGPPADRHDDISCGFGSRICTDVDPIILKQDSVVVVNDFLNTSDYALFNELVADKAAFTSARERKATPPYDTSHWMGRSSVTSELEAAMTQLMRAFDGYVARWIRISSDHHTSTTSPWAFRGSYFLDTWDLRHYVAGEVRRHVHLDTGNWGRCLCAMLFLGGHLGSESGHGGNFRTHRCLKGDCNHFAGWQHFRNASTLEHFPHLIHAGNLALLAEVPYKPGSIVFFLAETLHDVSEVTSGHQDALLIWWSCAPTLITGTLRNGHLPLIEHLIRSRADVDQTKELNGHLPMHRAAVAGHVPVMELLAKHGASIKAVDNDPNVGAQPMHIAALTGHVDVVEFLANKRASIEATNKQGSQPIHNAALEGHASMVERLRARRADIAAAFAGVQPMHLAAKKGHATIVQLLASFRAGVTGSETQGVHPMHVAAKQGHAAVVQILITLRSRSNIVDGSGMQPIHIASKEGHASVADILRGQQARL